MLTKFGRAVVLLLFFGPLAVMVAVILLTQTAPTWMFWATSASSLISAAIQAMSSALPRSRPAKLMYGDQAAEAIRKSSNETLIGCVMLSAAMAVVALFLGRLD